MTNFQVYKKVLPFSLVKFLLDLAALIIVVGASVLGFVLMNKTNDMALIGLVIGLVIGIIITVLLEVFVGNRITAAQISMMTIGVTEGKMPENTFKAGFESVKGRFGKITAFFFITNAIKGIFRQIGRGVERISSAIGGEAAGGVASAINSGIQIVIGYLCDCCLGWVLYRKEVNGFKAGCEGCVIFFKHGKTLIRNVGRIFGMGFLSLVIIGGAFFGISYLIFSNFPTMFEALAREITELSTRNEIEIVAWVTEPKYLMLIVCGIIALVFFASLHSVLVRPFILVGVLRNFMAAGIKDMPTEADFEELSKKSPKFAKLQSKI